MMDKIFVTNLDNYKMDFKKHFLFYKIFESIFRKLNPFTY